MGRGCERSPHVGRLRSSDALAVSHGGGMPMSLAYAIALAEARSCLAALADCATDFDESVHYEHRLLDLDRLHPFGPGLSPVTGTKAELLYRLEAAVDQMIDLGGNGLSLELLLAGALLEDGPRASG